MTELRRTALAGKEVRTLRVTKDGRTEPETLPPLAPLEPEPNAGANAGTRASAGGAKVDPDKAVTATP